MVSGILCADFFLTLFMWFHVLGMFFVIVVAMLFKRCRLATCQLIGSLRQLSLQTGDNYSAIAELIKKEERDQINPLLTPGEREEDIKGMELV